MGNMWCGNMIVFVGWLGMGKIVFVCMVVRCVVFVGWGIDMYSFEEDMVELMFCFIIDYCFEYGESFMFK